MAIKASIFPRADWSENRAQGKLRAKRGKRRLNRWKWRAPRRFHHSLSNCRFSLIAYWRMSSLSIPSNTDPQTVEFSRIMRVKMLDKSCDLQDQKERSELRTSIMEARREWLSMVLGRYLREAGKYHLLANHGDDLKQEGFIALLIAIDRFDPDMGANFGTYAENAVIGAFKQYLRDKLGLIRESRHNQEKRAASGKSAPVVVEQAACDDVLDIADENDFTQPIELRDAVAAAFESWDADNRNASRQRRAVYATFFEDATLTTLALELECGITQAWRYLEAGKERLKHFMEQQGYGS